CAYEWLMDITKESIDRRIIKRIKDKTYHGQELVPRPRRLALMNLFLHGLETFIYLGDSIYEPYRGKLHSCILTNPPFGTKGATQAPDRDDFTIETSNKQLNFVQHCMNILKDGGRAAIVLPDNCLFEDKAGEVFEILMQDCNLHTILRLPRGTFTPYSPGVKANVIFFQKGVLPGLNLTLRHLPDNCLFEDKAGEVFEILMQDCNLHTILRLPRGTFTPYSPGVKANVIFFQKGIPTENVWIFDARSNVPGITKKERPLTPNHFEEFGKCYGTDPNGRSERKDLGETGRFRKFHISEIKERNFKLDITWLKDESLEDANDLPEPQDLAAEAITELEAVVDELKDIIALMENEEGVEK
ncbi:MAG: N-6 DNA methylase, partial [Candidatus Micrarchaeota archaeon]